MKADFAASLAQFPYCADDPSLGVFRKSRSDALRHRLIQPNKPNLIRWLSFDIDAPDAYFRAEDRGLPRPSFIMVNRDNGHAHIMYELETPISTSFQSRPKPVTFLRDVQRGITNRLGADRSFGGNLVKNPTHPHWETLFTGASCTDLNRLNDHLDAKDKVWPRTEDRSGLGRNCYLFEKVRRVAYYNVFRFKESGKTEHDFKRFLEGAAAEINLGFGTPLFLSEVQAIVKSIVKWTWLRYNPALSEELSRRQSERAKRRWASYERTIKPQKASIS